MWRSGRQAFTILKSAECEVVALQETYMAAMSLGTRNEDGAGGWRRRHMKVRLAYGRENATNGDLRLKYVPGSVQLADILTKAVPAQWYREISSLWGMVEGATNSLKAKIISPS